MEFTLAGEMARTNRNLLLTNLILAAGLIAIGYLNTRYFYNFLFGPFAATPETLAAIASPSQPRQYWLKVAGEKMADSGMQEINVKRSKYTDKEISREVTADYGILFVGKRLLLSKVPVNFRQPQVTGSLEPIPEELSKDLIGDLEQRHPQLKGAFYPYMINVSDFRSEGKMGLGLGIPLLLACLFNVGRALWRGQDPNRHPLMQSLRKRQGLSPEGAAAQIDAELATGAVKLGPCLLTSSWYILRKFFSTRLVKLADILWAYEKVTRHYTNFIPTGKSFAVVVNTRQKETLEASCAKTVAESILGELSRRAPGVIVGFTDELSALWRKDPGAFAQAVDERAKKAKGQQA